MKDKVDKEGKAIMMEVDYSKVTPMLWKGMKEMIERIEILENMLEGKLERMKI